MNPSRARFVLCLVVFAALAVVAGSLIDQPEFDLVSGPEWSERVALADRAARAAIELPLAALDGDRNRQPAVPNGWILLAGGLIVSVLVLTIQARSQLNRSMR